MRVEVRLRAGGWYRCAGGNAREGDGGGGPIHPSTSRTNPPQHRRRIKYPPPVECCRAQRSCAFGAVPSQPPVTVLYRILL